MIQWHGFWLCSPKYKDNGRIIPCQSHFETCQRIIFGPKSIIHWNCVSRYSNYGLTFEDPLIIKVWARWAQSLKICLPKVKYCITFLETYIFKNITGTTVLRWDFTLIFGYQIPVTLYTHFQVCTYSYGKSSACKTVEVTNGPILGPSETEMLGTIPFLATFLGHLM